MSDLIIVKQIPIIEEKLKTISKQIDKEVEQAKSLVCTEENVKTVKEVRAKLNNTFKALEEERKAVKNAVMEPYNNFETIYKQCVTDKFKSADTEIKNKIDTAENELKTKKEQDIKDYFEEYKTANSVDFITLKQAKINVTLTASMKSLKEQAKAFVDKTVDDLNLIETQEYKAEILVEYKQSLNVSQAITTVTNRFKAIEEEKKKQEEKVVHIEMNQNHEISKQSYEQLENIFNKPLEQPKEEKQRVNLVLTVNEDEKRAIKEYLDIANISYESEEL